MREVKAIIRSDCLPRVVQALRKARTSRFYLSRVHALGSGVDPEDFRMSMDEGEAYTEKTKVEFLCPAERVDEFVEVIRACARTGHRGDGVMIVSEVTDVVNVRTGDHGVVAIL
jgi:nitrogen regulatory protein PII